MTRRGWLTLLPLVALAACDPAPPVPGTRDPTGPGAAADADPRIGPGVVEAAERGGARVVVALDPAGLAAGAGSAGRGGSRDPGADPDRLIRAVAVLTDGVLERVGRDALGPVQRYQAVPALAGVVRSADVLARLASDPAVVRIDLDVGGGGALSSSVGQIGADARHARGHDGAGVVVAILDTGADTDHPALAGRIVHQACFGDNGGGGFCPGGGSRRTGDGAAEDDAGHGTHVAGIVASDGAVGAPGVAPGASIVAVKVLDDCSFSGCFQSFSEIVAALDYLIVNHDALGTRVINMSLGTNALFSGVCDQETSFNMAGGQAINTLRELGVIAFAASMNNGSGTQMASPACLENVIAVGAVDGNDQVAGFSNGNAHTALLAPGVQIVSLARGGGTRTASGTSMATPHAAGCAALLVQADPSAAPDALVHRLTTSLVRPTDPKNDLQLPRLDCGPDPGPPDPRETATIERPDG